MPEQYTSEKIANEVLEYYERFLLRCEHIIYIAVVNGTNNNYSLEIGIKYIGYNYTPEIPNSEKVHLDSNLSDIDIYLGKFKDNTIPTSFPIPSVFEAEIKEQYIRLEPDYERKDLDKIKSSKSLKINVSVVKNNKKEAVNIENIKRKKIKNDRSIKIESLNKKATLGAIFKILEFPNDLFGITNQHLFEYENAKLGDPVWNGNKQELIGNLFWMADDIYREVAIIKMNNEFKERYESSRYSPLLISKPKIGMKVFHNGITNYFKNPISEIISNNATVRIKDNEDNDGWALYKKQILISDNTVPGDSGSFVLNNKNEVVGLNFAKTHPRKVVLGLVEEREFSVANNINMILNYKFQNMQEIFIKNTKDLKMTVTSLTNEFRTENYIK